MTMIHHYTSIAALASILRHRTIRFGRLDGLDDTQEAQCIGGIDFGKMLFASCWVSKGQEDIAQWAMYGDAMRGVRISLPPQPFAEIPRISESVATPELRYQGYTLLPDMFDDECQFISKVNYVDDVADEYAKRIEMIPTEGFRINGRTTELATFKNQYWSFQQEVRFILHAVVGPTGWSSIEEWAAGMKALNDSGKWGPHGPDVRFIDRDLSEGALTYGEVTLGPLSSDADRLIVEALISTLAPGLRLRESELKGLIRHR